MKILSLKRETSINTVVFIAIRDYLNPLALTNATINVKGKPGKAN